MEERPILFNGDMVRAVLGGRKTQTRRVVKWQPHGAGDWAECDGEWHFPNVCPIRSIACPYGKPGDRLWVRETWAHALDFGRCTDYFFYKASYIHGGSFDDVETWKPSIHMPRSASRIKLEVTNVRLERLQDITEEDAESEGIQFIREVPDVDETLTAVELFEELWDSINDKRGFGWVTNPWVWVVEFKAIAKGGVG